MTARPHLPVPVPDAVALLASLQLPPRVRDAVDRQAAALHRYAALPQPQYVEARWLVAQDLAAAGKVLAAHNPGLVVGWGDMPGLGRPASGCPECDGTGDDPECDGDGCNYCDQTGQCQNCHGSGKDPE